MTFKLKKAILALISVTACLLMCTIACAAGVRLGDADGDESVTIIDATAIQRNLAGLPMINGFSKLASDVNGNGEIEITDATYIQRWLAALDTPYTIDEFVEAPTEATEAATQPPSAAPSEQPTEQPTQQPTEQPTQSPSEPSTQLPTDEEGWGREIFKP